ncbi:MAG: TerB family tellurite resistance protein [Bacteroidota bacterium]
MNSEIKKKREHFKNLIALAYADGRIDEKEEEMLTQIGREIGLSKFDVDNLMNMGPTFQYIIPQNEEDREDQIVEMIKMAIIDGEFTTQEYDLCKNVAERLGFTETELGLIIKLCFKGKLSDNMKAIMK